MDVFSSRFTWSGGILPQDGDMVVVPSSQTLYIDVDTPLLSMLLING